MNGRGPTAKGLTGLAILAALAIGGIAGEFAVRLAEPELDPARHLRFEKPTGRLPVLGPRNATQRQIKNTGDFDVTIRFNRYGLRDAKDLAQGTANDVYLVGDSFTFGWGVEEQERLSERLESLIGKRVFNLSMPTGFDGYDRLLAYAGQNGARVRNVIIAVSMETDLRDYDVAGGGGRGVDTPGNGPGNKPGAGPLSRLKGFLTGNSALYVLATTLVHRSPVLKEIAVRAGLLVPNLEGVRQFAVSEKVIESSAKRLVEIAERYRTTVVVLPSRALWAGGRTTEEAKRHALFVARIRDKGLDVVDLRPAFENGGDPLRYHFANDPHWKPEGHALAAEVLAAHLKAR